MLSSVLWGRGVASFKLRFSSLDLEPKAWVQTGGLCMRELLSHSPVAKYNQVVLLRSRTPPLCAINF